MHELSGVPVLEAFFIGIGGEAETWEGRGYDVESCCEEGLEDLGDFGEVTWPAVHEEYWDCFFLLAAFMDEMYVE